MFGNDSLVEGLDSHNIRRIMEVGTHGNFTAVKQLLKLKLEGTSYLKSGDVCIVDPQLDDDQELRYAPNALGNDIDRVTIIRKKIEDAQLMVPLYIQPFDLVYCRGVVHDRDLDFLMATAACLNRNNPNSVLMIASTYTDIQVPYTDDDFRNAGLEIIASKQKIGSKKQNEYNLIICKPKINHCSI